MALLFLFFYEEQVEKEISGIGTGRVHYSHFFCTTYQFEKYSLGKGKARDWKVFHFIASQRKKMNNQGIGKRWGGNKYSDLFLKTINHLTIVSTNGLDRKSLCFSKENDLKKYFLEDHKAVEMNQMVCTEKIF